MLGQALIISGRRDYAQTLKQELLTLTDNRASILIERDTQRIFQITVKKFDLIVLDLVMDLTDGLQMLRLLKIQGPRVKFVVVYDELDPDLSEQAFGFGADLYVLRPQTEESWRGVMAEIDRLVVFGAPDPSPEEEEPQISVSKTPSGLLHIMRRETVPIIMKEEVLKEAPPKNTQTLTEISAPAAESPVSVVEPPPLAPAPEARTSLPNLDTRWKVSLMGELVEGAHLVDPERSAFITYFFYRKLADIAVTLEVDYFNHMTLYGNHLQQVVVADDWGIHHAVFETAWTTEPQREQFVKWCCEQSF